jgi:hypothetical protein
MMTVVVGKRFGCKNGADEPAADVPVMLFVPHPH